MSEGELQKLREENARLISEVESLRLLVSDFAAKDAASSSKAARPEPVISCEKEHELSNLQVQRYSRHLILRSFGLEAQTRLCSSSILVVGAGGLGSSIALYLAGAGVGKLGIVDKDTVSLDNLHRQIIHKESHVGMQKTISAKIACLELNSSIEVNLHHEGIHPGNALQLVKQYDVVVDGTDNVPTRYLVSDACVIEKKPLVSGAAIGSEGQLTVYNYGDEGPCYRCLFPESPAPATCSSCSDAGVLGPVPGAVGVLEALEAIKIAAKVGSCLSKRLLVMDFLSSQFRNVKLRGRMPNCIACGSSPEITEENLKDFDYFKFTGQLFNDNPSSCGFSLSREDRLSPEVAAQHLTKNAKNTVILDVRTDEEFRLGHLQGSINIPISRWTSHLPDILEKCVVNSSTETEPVPDLQPDNSCTGSYVLVVCRRGNDSQVAVDMLKQSGISWVRDVIGGLNAWSELVDPEMPKY